MTFSTDLPVMADRITIEGTAWAEPIDERTCTLFSKCFVRAKIMGSSPLRESQLAHELRY